MDTRQLALCNAVRLPAGQTCAGVGQRGGRGGLSEENFRGLVVPPDPYLGWRGGGSGGVNWRNPPPGEFSFGSPCTSTQQGKRWEARELGGGDGREGPIQKIIKAGGVQGPLPSQRTPRPGPRGRRRRHSKRPEPGPPRDPADALSIPESKIGHPVLVNYPP